MDANILRSKVSFFVDLFRQTVALEERTQQLTGVADELARSKDHFQALIEDSSDLTLILEQDATIRYGSPSVERILGYSREEICGQRLFELLHPDDAASLQADIAGLLQMRALGSPSDRRWRHVDGSYRVLESTAANLLRSPKPWRNWPSRVSTWWSRTRAWGRA